MDLQAYFKEPMDSSKVGVGCVPRGEGGLGSHKVASGQKEMTSPTTTVVKGKEV